MQYGRALLADLVCIENLRMQQNWRFCVLCLFWYAYGCIRASMQVRMCIYLSGCLSFRLYVRISAVCPSLRLLFVASLSLSFSAVLSRDLKPSTQRRCTCSKWSGSSNPLCNPGRWFSIYVCRCWQGNQGQILHSGRRLPRILMTS